MGDEDGSRRSVYGNAEPWRDLERRSSSDWARRVFRPARMNSNHLYTASLAKFKAEVKLPNNTANVRVFHLDFELQLRIGTEFNRVTG